MSRIGTRIRRRSVAAVGAVSMGVVVSALAAAPAQAEPYAPWELTVTSGTVATSWRCLTNPGWQFAEPERGKGQCIVRDAIDGSWFQDDAGGKAGKIMFRSKKPGQQIAGKVEFHPQGEHLYVYDTLNDGKSFWVTLDGKTYRPPGTSKKIDLLHRNLSIKDDRVLQLKAWGKDPHGKDVLLGQTTVIS